MKRTTTWSAVLVLGLAGCTGGEGGDEIVYDTIGGVPAVLNPDRGVLGDSVPWSLTEHLRVEDGQDYDGVAVASALDVGILADGGIAVLDAGNRRVLVFAADGSFEGWFGGQGEAPEQLANAFLLEATDSLVYVVDSGSNQVKVFARSGALTSRFEVDLGGLVGTTPLFEVQGADAIYMAAEPVPFRPQSRDTGSAVVYRLDGAGSVADTLVTYPSSRWTPIQLPDGRRTWAKPRFTPEPRVAASEQIAINTVAEYILELRQPDGTVTRRIARQYENIEVTSEIRDSVLNRLAGGPQPMPRETLEQVPFRDRIPAVEGLALDERGRVFVDVYSPGQPTRRDVFDAEGRYLGPLFLPEAVRIQEVRGDRLCGTVTGRRAQVSVVCYTVSEGGAMISGEDSEG